MPDYTCHYCGERSSMMGHKWCQEGITREEYYARLTKAKPVVHHPSGTRLCTKDGRIFGNAIIIGSGVRDDVLIYQIETDFGNVMFKRADEIDQHWWIANDTPEEVSLTRWLEAREELRSRSSMAEQPTVHRQAVGSVPTVTAT